jgi:serine/threonine-protein kinase
MVARTWAAGDVLADKYRLVAELGRGGMGSVWRAEHLVLRSHVAVKLVLSRVAESEPLRARFLREAQAAAALRSPHVVQILDFGVCADTPFMVMELLEGESLRERLTRLSALSLADTTRIVVHVARALERAREAGIVHRDLKPDNVFLVRNADEEIAKVLDFGIAKASGDTASGIGAETQTGAVLGTPHYMSPEQARGTRAVDHRSDVWALGVIAYECLTGRRPFDSAVLGDLLVKICTDPLVVPSRIAAVPPGFDEWMLRALEREPDRRFASAAEMADALRAVAGAGPSSLTSSAVLPTASIGPSVPPTSAPHSAPAGFGTHSSLVAASSPSLSPAAPRKRSPLVVPLVALLGVGAVASLGAAGYVYSQRQVANPAPSVSSLDEPIAARGADLLESNDAGAADAAPTRAGTRAAGPSSAPSSKAGGSDDWQGDVAKAQADAKKAQTDAEKARADAQKAREDAEKARAAAELLKKYGGSK